MNALIKVAIDEYRRKAAGFSRSECMSVLRDIRETKRTFGKQMAFEQVTDIERKETIITRRLQELGVVGRHNRQEFTTIYATGTESEMSGELKNQRHELFAWGIAQGKSEADAYREAGFKPRSLSVASAAGSRLLKNVKGESPCAGATTRCSEGSAGTLC